MTTDRQVSRLLRLIGKGTPLYRAAAKTGMDEKTARKYRDSAKTPSESQPVHNWRTRVDPFEEIWPEILEHLEMNPRLQAKVLFEWLQQEHPGQFQDGQLRTFQRAVKRWRASDGPAKEVFFGQVHQPGDVGASDFTHMTSLGVTIQHQTFEHMLYHFVLTYSNWEWATICFSESYESLADGLQASLWELGGVPIRHRTDRLSAAVNNLSDQKEFTQRYCSLMEHLGMQQEKIQARKANENGDVESLHRHLKKTIEQSLMLRGSKDFESRDEYAKFLQGILKQKNLGREKRLGEERKHLQALPELRQLTFKRVDVRVSQGSLIRVQSNVYSVESRLIGERVTVHVLAEQLEVWFGQKRIDTMPRLRGRNKSLVNYRHIIDSLVRKPGAFENYRYREDLFPTTHFRMAYDDLRERRSDTASREYVKILLLAARVSENGVNDALRALLNDDMAIDSETVEAYVESHCDSNQPTDVNVEESDLSQFDSLYQDKDAWYDNNEDRCEGSLNGSPTGVTTPNVPREL